jgi:hypothetical protein
VIRLLKSGSFFLLLYIFFVGNCNASDNWTNYISSNVLQQIKYDKELIPDPIRIAAIEEDSGTIDTDFKSFFENKIAPRPESVRLESFLKKVDFLPLEPLERNDYFLDAKTSIIKDPIAYKDRYFLGINLANSFDLEQTIKSDYLFYIDISSDMNNFYGTNKNNKIYLAKKYLYEIIGTLPEDSTVGIVLFNEKTYGVYRFIKKKNIDLQSLESHLFKDIICFGGVNLKDAYLDATNRITSDELKQEKRIVFISDKNPLLDTSIVRDIYKNSFQSVYTTIVQVGADVDPEIHKKANQIYGLQYVYCNDESNIENIASDFIGQNSLVYTDLKITLFSDKYKIKNRYNFIKASNDEVVDDYLNENMYIFSKKNIYNIFNSKKGNIDGWIFFELLTKDDVKPDIEDKIRINLEFTNIDLTKIQAKYLVNFVEGSTDYNLEIFSLFYFYKNLIHSIISYSNASNSEDIVSSPDNIKKNGIPISYLDYSDGLFERAEKRMSLDYKFQKIIQTFYFYMKKYEKQLPEMDKEISFLKKLI